MRIQNITLYLIEFAKEYLNNMALRFIIEN